MSELAGGTISVRAAAQVFLRAQRHLRTLQTTGPEAAFFAGPHGETLSDQDFPGSSPKHGANSAWPRPRGDSCATSPPEVDG